jgi:2,4-dienoyl-CoA reductase-like NADH-dependent reductase (Old Yellow Enzyme family)
MPHTHIVYSTIELLLSFTTGQDSQIAPLKLLTEFAHSQGQHVAIQLAHAGRKASTVAPWIDRKAAAPLEANGWPDKVLSVSNVPYDEHTYIPKTMTLEDIASFKESFIVAVKRALVAGFDVSGNRFLRRFSTY